MIVLVAALMGLYLVAAIIQPGILNRGRPDYLYIDPLLGRILASVLLVGLALVIGTHFTQFLHTLSE